MNMPGTLAQKYKAEAENIHMPECVANEGQVAWTCPSNIALVKYWGKRPGQLPMNPSISMTLEVSATNIALSYKFNPARKQVLVEYFFDQKPNVVFRNRFVAYLESVSRFLPFLSHMELEIRTENSFPHSAGIASSASSFGALALALCDMENKLYGRSNDTADFYRKASFLARLGSGSACRSLAGSYAIWGRTESYIPSSEEEAVSIESIIHPVFLDYHDSILVIDKKAKEISSSAGHKLMEQHPFSAARIIQSHKNIKELLTILNTGDIERFTTLVQEEAFTLHAMMMTSTPGFLLLKPNSLEALNRIREFREKSGTGIAFTMDAGANIHVLYPSEDVQVVRSFMDNRLKELCADGTIIHDRTGRGPVKIR
jgi:diphosphomevalonate decarboxylase